MCGVMMDCGSPLDLATFAAAFDRLAHRGPDDRRLLGGDGGWKLGFHRLAIMDPSAAGHQPFEAEGCLAACNGEIYNHRELRAELGSQFPFLSTSDCEVLIPLYRRRGIAGLVFALDGEFAFVLHDRRSGEVVAARDPIGIRPLFMGEERSSGAVLFASEAKALHPLCRAVRPFPPGHYYVGRVNAPGETSAVGELHRYADPTALADGGPIDDEPLALAGIRDGLIAAVERRLDADVPLGCLLSGGLDSSLVTAIAARHLGRGLPTFAIGLHDQPIDLRYAAEVSSYLGTDHREVRFGIADALDALDPVIAQIESFDVTTVRASLGMYLVCRHVRRETGVRVLLTGEVSDEIFGYKYTDFAPSAQAFQEEAAKRVRELYQYDVLRADRCISAHGLEARVPFSDATFVSHVMAIAPERKLNRRGVGKRLLREAFAGGDWLPPSILWREKAAFSDAVGHGMVDGLKAYAETRYSGAELLLAGERYDHCPPPTKEALLYREIFERHYPGRGGWIDDYWMPNREWQGCDVADPSARVLANYGASGV